MVEKRICCCGSGIWTKVIAWFEIIGSVLAVIFYALALVATVNLLTKSDNPDTKRWLSPQEIDEMKNHLTIAIVPLAEILV
ncbi:unnamed protein product [Allacma fusca]|uniref:Uncharacterized protein n=1 Tax=Allacma fusca TaxID=39272 RepID=A0A8J2LS88_9HEXA|nr:unnamed protein product [Allacma fusca]